MTNDSTKPKTTLLNLGDYCVDVATYKGLIEKHNSTEYPSIMNTLFRWLTFRKKRPPKTYYKIRLWHYMTAEEQAASSYEKTILTWNNALDRDDAYDKIIDKIIAIRLNS